MNPTSIALSPDNSPFNLEQVEWLNRFLPQMNADQLQWLSGFCVGMKLGQSGQSSTASIPHNASTLVVEKKTVTILYGSESGNSESLAKEARVAIAAAGYPVVLKDMGDYSLSQLQSEHLLLVIVSTWGEGDAPQSAEPFFKALMSEGAPKLPELQYAVLGLGDSSYQHFCKVGRDVAARLSALGAREMSARADADVDFMPVYKRWIESVLTAIPGAQAQHSPLEILSVSKIAAPAAFSRKNPFHAKLISNINLNGGAGFTIKASNKETRHIELSLEGSGLTYEAGDALGVIPTNDPEAIQELLQATGFSGDETVQKADEGEAPLRTALLETYDITSISRLFLQRYADRAGSSILNNLLKEENKDSLNDYLEGRQIIDLVHDYPLAGISAPDFVALLRKLPPRLYSIASSLKAHPGEVHLTVAAVRYQTHQRNRKGVCSTYVAERIEPGCEVPVYVHKNKNFRLPKDTSLPVIMVGPGTGIAPFRSFVEERAATGATGKNWLFFGDQHFATDFLYQTEWQQYLADGTLNRLDAAFSRDQKEKIYVHHRMLEKSRELYAWLEEGGYFYVCGDATRMAPDVNAALLTIIQKEGAVSAEGADSYIQRLHDEKRYQRDVY
jgi:sulfite reductase (NADPH) flavoprotein alpha-component